MKHKSRVDKDTNWNKEAYVTGLELIKMGGARASWFYNQPNIWVHKVETDCLFNLAHPDNEKMLIETVIKESGVEVIYENNGVYVKGVKII